MRTNGWMRTQNVLVVLDVVLLVRLLLLLLQMCVRVGLCMQLLLLLLLLLLSLSLQQRLLLLRMCWMLCVHDIATTNMPMPGIASSTTYTCTC